MVSDFELPDSGFPTMTSLTPGGADDASSLQSALDAAGTVLLGPGTFNVSRTLNVPSRTMIQGGIATILQSTGGQEFLLSASGRHDVSVRNLTLDGAGVKLDASPANVTIDG